MTLSLYYLKASTGGLMALNHEYAKSSTLPNTKPFHNKKYLQLIPFYLKLPTKLSILQGMFWNWCLGQYFPWERTGWLLDWPRLSWHLYELMLCVQVQLKKLCPESLFIHCANHSLGLVLQEAAREVSLFADSMNFVQSIALVIHESSKCKELYMSMFVCNEVVAILAIWATRCIRMMAIKHVCSTYREIIGTEEQLKDDRGVRGDTRAKIWGLYKQAIKAKLLWPPVLWSTCWAVGVGGQEFTEHQSQCIRCPWVNILHTPSTAGCAGHRVAKTPVRYGQITEQEAEEQHSWWHEFYEAVDLAWKQQLSEKVVTSLALWQSLTGDPAENYQRHL